MEMYPEQLPSERRPDSGRRAEDRLFDAIQDSDGPGSSNHEGQPDPEAPEVDFTLSLPGVGDFGLAGQGRELVTRDGLAASRSAGQPRGEALPVAPSLGRSNGFPRRGRLYPERFLLPVIAVLLFPNMEPDPAIAAWARRSNVQVLWGTDSLMD